ncbi:phage major capsid protein [Chitinophaga sp.]|uniref:phage major capsid protein n=1 Tax=Chitinophaga sp. TaxID=1869181 RepID=UPI0031D9FBFC
MFRRLYAMNFFYRDPKAEGAGGAEAVTKSLGELKTVIEEGQKKTGTEIKGVQDAVTEVKTSVESVKTEVQVIKDEQDRQRDALKEMKAAKGRQGGDPERKSFATVLKDAMTEHTDDLEKMARGDKGRAKSLTIELKAVGDITTGNVTGGTAWGQIIRPGIIEQPKRKVHVRQLVPTGTIGAGTEFVFMRDNGGEGAPAPAAEGDLKSQLDLDLVEDSVKIETIAAWCGITRKAMNNIPGMISFMQSRLPELLLREEDRQFLTGNGVSPNLKGILTDGNYTAADTSATVLVEQIIDSIAQLEDEEEREADGILIRPREYYSFFKQKATGSGEYDLPKNVTFVNGVLYISGIPVYASTAMNKDFAGNQMNKFIVGDWTMGAQLLFQEDMRIEISEHDVDNFRRNKYTIRIEETVALPVYGDNYFIAGDVAAEPA